jgi:hypothetical protein
VGGVDTPGEARGVAVSGSHAYVADGGSGLQVVDVSNPASPQIVGAADPPGAARDVAVSGRHVYVASGSMGFYVVDVSNPAIPRIMGGADTPDRAWGVALSGDYAYVADRSSGLQVVDISTPASPRLVGGADTPGQTWGVAVSGSYAYVANDLRGLKVANLYNPASPRFVGGVNTPGEARGVAVSESYAYIADYTSGLQIVPAQCEVPVTPSQMLVELTSIVVSLELPPRIERSLLATLEAAGRALDRGNDPAASRALHAFVKDVEAERGQHISDPDADALIQAAEAIVTMLETAGTPPIVDGKDAQVPASIGTLGVFRLSAPAPNPFDCSTTIRFALPRRSSVSVGVYDVAGRLVRVLVDEDRPQGAHTLTWDGRAGDGYRVSGGTYFVKLAADEVTQTRKVVFLGGK